MRVFTSGFLALALSASGALAAGSEISLAPGHPAGLKQAEMSGNTIMYVALGAAAIAAIAIAASNGSSAPPTPGPVTTTTTTTTTG